MSALDDLRVHLYFVLPEEDMMTETMEMVSAVLREHAHELAEQIRTELAEKVSESLAGGVWEIRRVATAQRAADLIDPEVAKP